MDDQAVQDPVQAHHADAIQVQVEEQARKVRRQQRFGEDETVDPGHMRRFGQSRQLSGETYQLIAGRFNKKDHTTVMAAERRIAQLVENDPKVAQDVTTLTAKLAP